ncbi:histidine kinase [Burkholderia ubonensis]|uniref:PAS domain S-box protein n=1 Tax=Burkholderia ubonensis TaxID=101571 RepID=UPI0007547172|nr:PAS domain S-box protein [Burkholderia ubonensis]KVH80531.1 histidine kinase [Burkholderia ubonensis]KVU05500.1 histidine kinase [Burkholderia ubonensis]
MRLPLRFARDSLSLHSKLMFSLVVFLTLVAGVATYTLVEHERERRLVALEERAARIADLYSQSLAQPLWNVDRGAIEGQLAALAPNREVSEFTVTAMNYGQVATVKRTRLANPDEGVVRIRAIEYDPPGNTPREKIGEIRVVFTKAVAEQEITNARRAIFAVMAVVVVALYVVTFILVKRMVCGPIRRLEEMVDRIAGGDLDVRCAVESGDELGRLAERVNVMADRLCESTARLLESERKYRGIVENSPEGIFLLDRCGQLTEANPAMARLLGYAAVTDLITKGNATLEPFPFSDAQVERLFNNLHANGEIAGLELELHQADGQPIWVQLNARGVTGRDGRAAGVEGFMTDITARKLALENLRRQRDQLESEVDMRRRTERELLASREQLRQLSAHLEAVREDERKCIALEIHDELGQLLTALKMDLSLLRMQLVAESPAMLKADQMRLLVEKTMQIVRNVASNLRPAALNFGLASALEWLADDFTCHTQIPCCFRIEGIEPNFSDPRATAIFRIVQESLTNVARHADASSVEVLLSGTDTGAELIIRDDGRGFDMDAVRTGHSYGLQGMAERARLIEAHLRIKSSPGAGSLVYLRVRDDAVVSQ